MADNVTFQTTALATLPDGTVVSTDDSGATGHVQRVKLAYSADGAITHVTADADGLLVNLGANNDFNLTQLSGNAVDLGNGNVGAGTIRVTLAADTTGVLTVDTELPTAAALGDDAANPTVPAVGAYGMFFDGTTWDRVRGTSADGLLVNLGANNDVTIAGTVTVDGSGVTQPVSGTITANAGTGTFTVDSELPAAAALGDNTANPTAPAVGSFAHVWDGATWDRVPGNSADGVLVNLGTNNDVTVSGTVTANAGTGTFTVDTELPAAAAMADAASNPTVPAVGARNSVFNGTTWDRMRGNTVGSYVHGGTAHDAADAGNPVKIGFRAFNLDGTVPGTAVAENDRVNGIADVYGRQFIETTHPNFWQAMGLWSTAQTDVSVRAAPGAGLSLYITDIVVSTDTAMNIFFEQGTTKVYGTLWLAANGGASSHFRTPIKLPANTALTFTSSAAGNHSVTVNGFTAP